MVYLQNILLLCLLVIISGCAVNSATALRIGDTDIKTIKSVYLVEQSKDNDNYKIIKALLEKRGYTVVSGLSLNPPYPYDLVVTYLDKWYWDLAPYMIDLTIVFRDPHDNFPIVGGSSYHTSLTRLSPEEMTDEVLNNIFNATIVKLGEN